MGKGWSRRRVLIAAALGGSLPLFPAASAPAAVPLRRWDGVVLGAEASMVLACPDPALADAMVGRCLAEVRRLERIFSLYRGDSDLVRLNREGSLDAPPPELVELLSTSGSLWRATGGMFDPSVQPLWDLFARAGTGEPPADGLAAALRRVGFGAVEVSSGRVAFGRPGMALTLNGIAQGYIADRVADLLRGAGFTNVLLDLGETRALGPRPDGRPWQVAIADPADPDRTALLLPLDGAALATSGGYGTPLGPGHNHLFDPSTGASPPPLASVSVVAPTATLADGLSTAFALMPRDRVAATAHAFPGIAVHRVEDDRVESLAA